METDLDQNLATPCGLYCGECLYYKKTCKGCVPSDGRPSWGRCKTYACTVEKKVEHCGECVEFPCWLFLNQYSRELGPWRVFYKAGQLVYRKKNADPKVAMERHLEWEKTQKKQTKKARSG
jgi:hypothetical protein